MPTATQDDELDPQPGECDQCARDRRRPEELRLAVDAPVVVHADLGEAGAGVLELAHELDADDTGGVDQFDTVERTPPDEAEVAVGVADVQAEEERDEAVVHATNDTAEHAVCSAQLEALDDVDVVGRVPHEELQLSGIELSVAVGVEDPLLAGVGEARQQGAAVPPVLGVRYDAE